MMTSQLLVCFVVYIRLLCLCSFLDILSSEPVYLSVRPSHAGIVCKRLHMSTKFFRRWIPHHSSFSIPNGMAIFRRPPPPDDGAECKGGYEKIMICDEYRALSLN